MTIRPVSQADLDAALSLRDLTDPTQGPHGLQILVELAHQSLASAWGCERLLYRASPIVTPEANYDDLGYPPDGRARESRYTRYVAARALLRTQTSSAIPTLLRALGLSPPRDLLLICPGLVYRRDVIDRLHVGEPHQLDLWRISKGAPLTSRDLEVMVSILVAALLPGRAHRLTPAQHPYTIEGRQIDVETREGWVEIGECGLACPGLLERSGLNPGEISGLAMGLGLDRLLMLRKEIPDIRLLRSADSRVEQQMRDLRPYRRVSALPAVRRDLSLAVPRELEPEELGDLARQALGNSLESLESLEILSETPYEVLVQTARDRMGMRADQKNVLVRLTIRHPTRTLRSEEANRLRDIVYLALHQGEKQELANG